MRCTSPLLAVWYCPDVSPLSDLVDMDKPRIIGRYKDSHKYSTPARALHVPEWMGKFLRFVKLPCGKCDACRLVKSAEWSYRCRMESMYHEANSFITLTVSDKFFSRIFPGGSLQYPPYQSFMKRLRSLVDPGRFRFLMCGEYGAEFERPHYHALIFGWDFPDKVLWKFTSDGFPVFRSPVLEEAWSIDKEPIGFSTVEEMNDRTIQYVCRYVLKKQQSRCDYGGRMPEFIRCSNRPGIGAQFFKDFVGKDFYKRGLDGVWFRDYVLYKDFKMKMPRYYDKLFERLDNADFVSLRTQRFLNAPDPFLEDEKDLARRSEYLRVVTKGRIKKENFLDVEED